MVACMLALPLIVFSNDSQARNTGRQATGKYYIDAVNGSDHNDGISKNTPWQTLKKLHDKSFLPGDTVFFAKGMLFKGGFAVTSSGKAGNPVVFTSYGEGSMPAFTNEDRSLLNGNVLQVHGSYITIDGLYFTGCANAGSKVDKEILLTGAVYAVTGADHFTVRNCTFNDCPIGVTVNSRYSLVTHNQFRDCNRFLSEPDWGPIAVLIGNAYNEVCYNECSNYVKVGGNYGADGGFIELDDRYFGNKVHHVNIHHNRSIANQGFLEIESKVEGDSLNVYYNVSDDYQQFIFFWGGNNSKIENNTVIRTRPSNNGAVNTVFTMRNSRFTLRNNIFVVANGIQVFVTAPYDVGNYKDAVHENNIYFCTDGSTKDPCGKILGKNESIVDPGFADMAGGNFRLTPASPAIAAGQYLGYKNDMDNKILQAGKAPDTGAYQYQ